MSRRRGSRFARRATRIVLALLFLGAVLAAERAVEWFEAGAAPHGGTPVDARGPCRAERVVDGDTAHLRCGDERLHVRLLRVDTPERDEPRYREATDALRRLVDGRDVYVAYEEPGHPARGNYGRLLAYLFVDGANVNVELVRAGWSGFDTRWGEGRFAAAFGEAEREAERAGRL